MSNGSERTPERCVHASDGPDWAGLWELPTPKPDYEALVREARTAVHRLHPLGTSPMDDRVLTLADAVEALVAERDALRTQLDSMTVETRDQIALDSETASITVKLDGTIIGPGRHVTQRRLVSPWTVVEGDDQ